MLSVSRGGCWQFRLPQHAAPAQLQSCGPADWQGWTSSAPPPPRGAGLGGRGVRQSQPPWRRNH
eukprot:1769813-Lingulodinium_polyedra.AAC.1